MKDVSHYEFPALDWLWSKSRDEEFEVLYLHTKGVGNPSPFQEDWREYMLHFVVDRWRDRVEDLREADCTGVNLGGEWDPIVDRLSECGSPPEWDKIFGLRHYSGNFWWSKSSHLRRLPRPYDWIPGDGDFRRWRMACEMWVCQLQGGRYIGAWASGVDHYKEGYPRERYVGVEGPGEI